MFANKTMSLWMGARVLVLCFTLVMMMTGCGGGGGGSFTPDPTPPVTDTTVPEGQIMYADLNPGARVDTLKMQVAGTVEAPGQLAVRLWMSPYMVGARRHVETEVTAVAPVWNSHSGSSAQSDTFSGPLPMPIVYNGVWVRMDGGKGASSVERQATEEEIRKAVISMMATSRNVSTTTTKRLAAVSAFHEGRPLTVTHVDTGGAAGGRVVILDASICTGDKILVVAAVEDADAEAWWAHLNKDYKPTPKPNITYKKSGGGSSSGKGFLVSVGLLALAIISLPCPAIDQELTATGGCPPGHDHEPPAIIFNVGANLGSDMDLCFGEDMTISATATANGQDVTSATAFTWSLDFGSGTLSSTTGPSTTFTAGQQAGAIKIGVRGNYQGKTSFIQRSFSVVDCGGGQQDSISVVVPGTAKPGDVIDVTVGGHCPDGADLTDNRGFIRTGLVPTTTVPYTVPNLPAGTIITFDVNCHGLHDDDSLTVVVDQQAKTYSLQADPPAWEGFTGMDGQDFEFWIVDNSTGMRISQLDPTMLEDWSVSPSVESWATPQKGTFLTYRYDENFVLVEAVTPGDYIAHASTTYLGQHIETTILLNVMFQPEP